MDQRDRNTGFATKAAAALIAAALVAAGRADSLADAMPMAVQSIDTRAARAKLGALVEFTNR